MRLIFTYIALLMALSLSAQTLDREAARSVYSQYDFDAERIDEPAPKGFKPFYISHYGRHGARYIYRDSEYELLFGVFSRAQEAGVLTPLGKDLYDSFMRVYPYFHGRAGELTLLGQHQHRMLASRLLDAYPQIFNKKTLVRAESSIYPRCIMSMNAFCDVLRGNGCEVYENVDGRNMAYMAPYSRHNPKFKGEDQSWRREYAEYFDTHFDRTSFYGRLFSDPDFASSIEMDMDFIMTLYYMDAHMAGTEFPEISFGEAFSDDDYALCNEMDNIKFYMRKGWGEGWQGKVNVALGEALMRDILEKAETAIASGQPSADLRFGHDGAIMTLLAFLRAEGWNKRASCMSDIKNVWCSSRVPMASNIRFIFLKKGNEVIVKAQYNESDLKLPIEAYSGPYYRWSDFLDYYEEQIINHNQTLRNDYH